MKDYSAIATKNFLSGYNCSQSVLLTFADEIHMDRQTAAALASSFGGGMGRMREVCGAVSGMLMAAGLLYGYTEPNDRSGKIQHYKLVQELAAKFREKNSSIVCRELLGLEETEIGSFVPEQRTAEYYKKRPCKELIGMAAQILGEYLEEHPPLR